MKFLMLAPVAGLAVPRLSHWPLPNCLRLHGEGAAFSELVALDFTEPQEVIASLRRDLGQRTLNDLIQSQVFFVDPFEIKDPITGWLDGNCVDHMCHKYFGFLNHFLLSLWAVKDFAFALPTVFLLSTSLAYRFSTLRGWVTDCSAGEGTTMFTADEIHQGQILAAVLGRISRKPRNPDSSNKSTAGIERLSACTADRSRVDKTLLFLCEARAMPDLGMRIAHYCSSLEAMFCSDDGEIAHQLAERVAWFIEPGNDQRKETYQKVKEAYTIRCRILHGEFLKPKKLPDLVRISRNCDVLLRSVILRIANHPEHASLFAEKDGNFRDYFQQLVLGALK